MMPGRAVNRVASGGVCAAAGVCTSALLARWPTLALDVDMINVNLLLTLAFSLSLGAVLGLFVCSSARATSVVAGVAGTAWIALFHTGAPAWVTRLVVVGLAAVVAALIGALADLQRGTARTTVQPWAAAGAGSFAAGALAAMLALAWFPELQWATITAVAGAALFAAVFALSRAGGEPTTSPLATTSPLPTRSDPRLVRAMVADVAVGRVAGHLVAATWFAAVGLIPLAGRSIGLEFGAGERYRFLTLALGALGGLLVGGIGHWWHGLRGVSTERLANVTGLVALLGALAVLVAVASRTLIGAVAGSAAAITAAITVVVCATALAGGPEPDAQLPGSVARQWVAAWCGGAAGLVLSAIEVGWDALGPRSAAALGALLPFAAGWRLMRATGGVNAGAASAGSETVRSSSQRGSGRVAVLEASGVTTGYGAVQVLFGVDVVVGRGECVAILGTNGVGKTTFLRTVAGLQPQWDGTLRIAGRDLTAFDATSRSALGLCLIGPGAAIAEGLTVDDNLRMFAHGIPAADAAAGRADALTAFPRLAERLTQAASSLSGGEKQMLGLAKAYVRRPRLVIIDEFTLGLAPVIVAQLVPAVRALNERGTAVLLVEQSAATALTLADRVVVMDRGTVVYEGATDDLRLDPGRLASLMLDPTAQGPR